MSLFTNKIFKSIKILIFMEDVSFLDDKLPNEIINIIIDFLEEHENYNLWYDYYMYPFY